MLGCGVDAAVCCSNGAGMCESGGWYSTAVGWTVSEGSSTGANAVPVEALMSSVFADATGEL